MSRQLGVRGWEGTGFCVARLAKDCELGSQ
jgi:hypothetical protein